MGVDPKKLLIFSIIYRLASIFLIPKSYIPDEYWQSQEVAHKLVFGYGYLTWEWREKTKSFIHPFIISIIYTILKLLHLDYPTFLLYVPRILQALLSSYADYRFYCWTKSAWTSIALMINGFWLLCATKTLTNSFETALTIIALSSYSFGDTEEDKIVNNDNFLWLAGFIWAVRPSRAIAWIALCIYDLRFNVNTLAHLVSHYLKVVIVTLAYLIAIDSYCYGELVFSPWNSVKASFSYEPVTTDEDREVLWYFNRRVSSIKETYYVFIPFVMKDLLTFGRDSPYQLFLHFTMYLNLLLISWIGHDELSLILPVLLIIICILSKLMDSTSVTRVWKNVSIGMFIVAQALTLMNPYFIYHGGPLTTMDRLSNELKTYRTNYLQNNYQRNELDVLMLTPCYSLPLYSHLHQNVTARFLTCDPNFHNSNNYITETDRFFNNSMGWIYDNYDIDSKNFNPLKLPAFVIILNNSVKNVTKFLKHYRIITKTTYRQFFEGEGYDNSIHLYEYLHKYNVTQY